MRRRSAIGVTAHMRSTPSVHQNNGQRTGPSLALRCRPSIWATIVAEVPSLEGLS